MRFTKGAEMRRRCCLGTNHFCICSAPTQSSNHSCLYRVSQIPSLNGNGFRNTPLLVAESATKSLPRTTDRKFAIEIDTVHDQSDNKSQLDFLTTILKHW